MLGFDELRAYNVLPPPHMTSVRPSRDGCFSSCSGSFPGFVGLRFICPSCVVSFEVREHGSGMYCCV
jgi:hypothetical protein